MHIVKLVSQEYNKVKATCFNNLFVIIYIIFTIFKFIVLGVNLHERYDFKNY